MNPKWALESHFPTKWSANEQEGEGGWAPAREGFLSPTSPRFNVNHPDAAEQRRDLLRRLSAEAEKVAVGCFFLPADLWGDDHAGIMKCHPC